MTAHGWYERFHDEKNGAIQDSVKMDVESDSDDDRRECLKQMMILHEVLEEYQVFKEDAP